MTQATTWPSPPATGAEALLMALKAHGIDYLFANAGTDFPPIIEALAAHGLDGSMPTPLAIAHETVAMGMAHGVYLATGRPQAVMVHVNVGLANAAMGLINAASDNVPVIVASGRTPLTEHDRTGARVTPIQYGQEMYDQTALVREMTKFACELHYGEQATGLVTRAISLANSAPCGPVYLSLPREPLSETLEGRHVPAPIQAAASPSQAEPGVIAEAARMIARAEAPLIICQRGDPVGATADALSSLANTFAIPVVEPFPVRNVLATDDPMHLGCNVTTPLKNADLVIVIDAHIPWIEKLHRPEGKSVITLGPDPLFAAMPVRSFRSDLSITCDPATGITALHAELDKRLGDNMASRRARIVETGRKWRETAARAAAEGQGTPMSANWISKCLSDVMGTDGVVFSELGVVPEAMQVAGANRVFSNPHSGGLGWALPAALGSKLARPERLTTACIGDGSYMFANPVACHQAAEALGLPVLIVVKNNGMWNAVRRSVRNGYPDGAAMHTNTMPLTTLEPSPDYCAIARASRAHAERVADGRDLPDALARAVRVITTEQRPALVEVMTEVSDVH